MPRVGSKHFGYGPKGVAQAKKEAKKTGQDVTMKPPAGMGPAMMGGKAPAKPKKK